MASAATIRRRSRTTGFMKPSRLAWIALEGLWF